MKNLHVPLPEALYRRLRAESERSRRPATELAREAIRAWLAERHRLLLHDEIQAYAVEVSGSREDLDGELESAAVEQLAEEEDEEEGGSP
jgi:hypothetical protein